MLKKAFVLVVLVAFLLSGCAWFCKNQAGLGSKLTTTIEELKVTVASLNAVLQQGYDAEIELAYQIAVLALNAATPLAEQWCPDETKVNEVVASAEKLALPKGRAAMARAVKLKLIK